MRYKNVAVLLREKSTTLVSNESIWIKENSSEELPEEEEQDLDLKGKKKVRFAEFEETKAEKSVERSKMGEGQGKNARCKNSENCFSNGRNAVDCFLSTDLKGEMFQGVHSGRSSMSSFSEKLDHCKRSRALLGTSTLLQRLRRQWDCPRQVH